MIWYVWLVCRYNHIFKKWFPKPMLYYAKCTKCGSVDEYAYDIPEPVYAQKEFAPELRESLI